MDFGKKPNNILRHERQVRGWSQQRIAEFLGTSEDVVSRWERGERKPSPFFQEKLCVLYGKTAVELGFIQPAVQHLPPVSIAHMTDIGQTIHERLEQAESMIDLAWEAWFASRPKQAAREMTKLLPGLEKLAYIPSNAMQSFRVKELVIRCHGLLGAVCLDALQNDTAFYHYMQAHRFAEEIHDTNLAVTYLALMGDVLRRQNDKASAVSYMENARVQAVHVNRATMGHILQLLAYTYADVGNETAFERTIAEAINLLAFTGEGRDIAKKEFIPFEIYEIQGKANRDLGRPLKAIPYLELAEKSLGRAETVTPRWHALLDISRGQAYCDAGDITTGVELASKGFTLAYQCQSSRQMNRVRKLLKKLEGSQYKGERKVVELRELVHEAYLNIDLDK